MDGPATESRIEGSADPEGGAIAQWLDDRPVAQFLAVGGAAIGSAVLGSSVIRRMGQHATQSALKRSAKYPGGGVDEAVKTFREAQSKLDEFQAVNRIRGSRRVEMDDGTIREVDDPTLDEVTEIGGFHFTRGERQKAMREGHESLAHWSLRDEIQQTTVKQARRLPYELPAAYVSQRAITDRMLGVEDPDVDWGNPLDVGADFVGQSAKNIGMAFAPFSVGTASMRHGFRRAMTYGEQGATGFQGTAQDYAGVSMQSTLRMVGHDAADLLNKTVQLSKRSGGAISAALRETSGRTRPLTESLERTKFGAGGKGGPDSAAATIRRQHGESPPTGPLGQIKTFSRKLKEEWNRQGKSQAVTGQHSRAGQFARDVDRLRGPEDDILQGEFGRQHAQARYSDLVKRNLERAGVDTDIADATVRYGRFTPPPGERAPDTHLSNRVSMGDAPIYEGAEDFATAFGGRAQAVIGRQLGRQDAGEQLSPAIRDAIRRADQDFISQREQLTAQVGRQWDEVERNVIGQQIGDALPNRRLPFSQFDDPTTPEARHHLLQRTAARMGIDHTAPTGMRRTDQELSELVAARGVDPVDPYSMRSYLINQGEISPDYLPDGFNLLGMRPVSMREAIDEEMMGQGREGQALRSLGRAIDEADPSDFTLDRTAAGGLYRGVGGQTIDFGEMRQSVRAGLDRFASEFKIPLLGLRPMDMIKYRDLSRMASGPGIRYSGPMERQPTLGESPFDERIGDFWMRESGSRGRVVRAGIGDSGEVEGMRMPGQYRPNAMDPNSGLGRAARRIVGDEGVAQYDERTRWQEAMDVPERQDGSVVNLARRFRRRGDRDPRHPNHFARGINQRGRAFVDELAESDPATAARGARGLASQFRDSAIPRNVLRNLDDDSAIRRAMRYGDEDIIDMDSRRLRGVVDELADEDLSGLPRAAREDVERARRNMLERWRGMDPSEIDQMAPDTMRQSGIHRRSDELRMDLARYLGIRTNAGRGQGLAGELDEMGRELDSLHQRGAISRQELAEGKAAVSSFHTAHQDVVQHAGRQGLQQRDINLARSMLDGPEVVREAIQDAAEYQRHFSGIARLLRPIRERLTPGRGPDDAVTFNPLQAGQEDLFVPTTGTAFRNNPLRAAASGLGFTNYRDPEHASMMSNWTGHLMGRMNDFVKFAHMGVREGGRYHGSMDMFARGMIGRRAAPLVAGGATGMAIDRELGGMIYNEEDAHGDTIYRPFIGSMVGEALKEAQVGLSAITPWGMTGEERRAQLEHGDVPIRRGRFWPFGDCVTPDTPIQLSGGQTKRADEVEEGDLLLTHRGTWEPVLRVVQRDIRDDEWAPMLELHSVSGESFQATTTDDHPYLAVKRKYCPHGGSTDCRPDRAKSPCRDKLYAQCHKQAEWSPQWIKARDLEAGDWVAYPRQRILGVRNTIAGLPANSEVGYILGLYLAEGNIHSKKNNRWYGAEFSLHAEEDDIRDRLESYVEKYFRIKPKHQYRERSKGMKVRYLSVAFGEFLRNAVYDEDGKKLPAEIFEYSEDFVKGILAGWFDGDSHVKLSKSAARFTIKTCRLRMGVELRNLLLALRIPTSITEVEQESTFVDLNGHGGGTYKHWELSVTGDAARKLARLIPAEKLVESDTLIDTGSTSKYIYIDNRYVYIKIRSVVDTGYRGQVFDYEVQNSHSFSSTAIVLHNTPWMGDDIMYYRPSWYRRLMGAPDYTDQQHGRPIERLMFGYDFSPLRPLDPYRWERQQGLERPYPVSGDYFTGPWGPLRGVLNQTVGELLKPTQIMHEEHLQAGMANMMPVGGRGMAEVSPQQLQSGAVSPQVLPGGGAPGAPIGGQIGDALPAVAGAGVGMGGLATPGGGAAGATGGGLPMVAGGGGANTVEDYEASAGQPAYLSGSSLAQQQVYGISDEYAAAAGERGRGTALANSDNLASPAEFVHGSQLGTVAAAEPPIPQGGFRHGMTEIAHQAEEWTGIYGFAFGAIRGQLGFGDRNYPLDQHVLPSASQAYGQQGQFWDLELGGLGDFPTPMEGQFTSLELSELARRFIGKERTHDEFNPIPNLMGQRHPWLPGEDHFEDFTTGDAYGMPSGIMRMPGQAYERFNQLHPDDTGRYGRLDQLRILANVAPHSQEYRNLEQQMRQQAATMDEYTLRHVTESMRRAESIRRRHEFDDYTYRYSSPSELETDPISYAVGYAAERFAHRDTFAHRKLGAPTTATEDWERNQVYGTSFGAWENPIDSFVNPAFNLATARDPVSGTAYSSAVGAMFGASREARVAGGLLGGAFGLGASAYGMASELWDGERHIPEDYQRSVAIEEYVDIIDYMRNRRARNMAMQYGAEDYARYFEEQMGQTMYGMDVYNASIDEMARAVPGRKREHFEAMAQAPEEERDRILSTAGRLERRMYQGLWGEPVEARPDLTDYFSERELPPEDWVGWDPRVDLDQVEIKMAQDQGINTSHMGYYPQEVQRANMMNLSYPDMYMGAAGPDRREARQRIEELLRMHGVAYQIVERQNQYQSSPVQLSYGG